MTPTGTIDFTETRDSAIRAVAAREQFRDQYGQRRDPIHSDRLLWRAQTFRHMVHILPGQTVLELGAGSGMFTRQLAHVTRGENPITAVTFNRSTTIETLENVERLEVNALPGPLEGRTFDFIVGLDLLDQHNCVSFLQSAYKLLKPGGQIVFYESNPWNVVLKLRRFLGRITGRTDPRHLLNRRRLYELMSEIGFVRILALYNDFVYAPLNRPTIWLLRNLSIVLENLAVVQTLAGSILIYAQKPGGTPYIPSKTLCDHESLRNAVSVVVPCHNEEMNVRPLITRLMMLYGDYLHEIVLVDDNSKDRTAEVIRSLMADFPIVKGVFRKPPNGVGRALSDGYRATTGRYVLTMDCDFLHLLPEIRDLFDAAAKGCAVAVGSRFSRHSVLLNYPIQKIIANRAFHLIAQVVFRRHFRDLTNNLKLLRGEVVDAMRLEEPHFAVNAETGLQPLLMGFDVAEVPISWINRTPDMGVSSFHLAKVGGDYWRVLLRLAWKTRFGFRALARRT
jgi:SAM-dependent methyltransferase